MSSPVFGASALQWVGTAPETVYGTPAAAPSWFHPTDGVPAWTTPTENLKDNALRGYMGVNYQQGKGLRYDQVMFKTPLYLDSAYPLIRSAMGLPDVISGASAPYTHKTSLQSGNNGQPASTTVFYYDALGKTWQMPGAQVVDLKVTIATGGLAFLEITYVGLPAVPITPPTNTPSTAKPMPSWNTTVTIGGTAQQKYSQVVLDIKRGTKMIPTITGTQSPFAIFAGAMEVNGTLDGIYQGSTDTDITANFLNTQPVLLVKIAPAGDAINSITFQASVVAYEDTKLAGGTDWQTIQATVIAQMNATDVAGGGGQSPLLVTMLSPVSTAI